MWLLTLATVLHFLLMKVSRFQWNRAAWFRMENRKLNMRPFSWKFCSCFVKRHVAEYIGLIAAENFIWMKLSYLQRSKKLTVNHINNRAFYVAAHWSRELDFWHQFRPCLFRPRIGYVSHSRNSTITSYPEKLRNI